MFELRLEGIRKHYGRKILFREFSCVFRGGKITMLRGKNGRGKSTLLKMAGGLLLPDAGKISLWENGVNLGLEELAGKISMVSPELGLYGKLTAEENLLFFANLCGYELLSDEVDVILDKVGLGERRIWVENFSTGMRQRLKLGILLAARSRIALLDEPCSNLDDAGKELVGNIAKRKAEEGSIVLWATNEAQEEGFADELLHLD